MFFCSLAIVLFLVSGPVHSGDYIEVSGPCHFQFPRDHGVHPGYLVEWWYYTGNLSDTSGKRYGFQLTFFRTRISPLKNQTTWPVPSSSWRTNQLFFAHAALSDLNEKHFYYDQQMARGAVGLAGVEQWEKNIKVYLGAWSTLLKPDKHLLKAQTDDFELDLMLKPVKPPVAHGKAGYSLKGVKPESASCYYSFTRLEVSGRLNVKGNAVAIKGIAWMDHEFSSAPLEPDIVGWDWFSLQFTNNTELMIYLLRNDQGIYSSASSGTLVMPSGQSRHLSFKDIHIDILKRWKSPNSGAVYPSRWRIQIHPLRFDLLVKPNMADQELITRKSTRVTYWEGSVSVSGAMQGEKTEGVGYVEMTGYAAPFNTWE